MTRSTTPDWSLGKSLGLLAKLLLVIGLLLNLAITLFNAISKPSKATSPTPPPPVVNVTINNYPPRSHKRSGGGRQAKKTCPCDCPEHAENCGMPACEKSPLKEPAGGVIGGDENTTPSGVPPASEPQDNQVRTEKTVTNVVTPTVTSPPSTKLVIDAVSCKRLGEVQDSTPHKSNQ